MSEAPEENDEATERKSEELDGSKPVEGREKLLIDIWKQAVDTQKHFNDMCVKSRQLGLTFVAASLGAALYLFIRSPVGPEGAASSAIVYAYSFEVCGHTIVFHVSLAIVAAAVAAVFAVRKLDLGVYHLMLRGAVTFGEDIEELHIRPFVGLRAGMTQAISHFSRFDDAAVIKGDDRRYIYAGKNKKSAGEKLRRFYQIILVFLAIVAAAIFFASNFMKAVA